MLNQVDLALLNSWLEQVPDNLVSIQNFELYYVPRSEAFRTETAHRIYSAVMANAPARLSVDEVETFPIFTYIDTIGQVSGLPYRQWYGTLKAIIWALSMANLVPYVIDNGPIVPVGNPEGIEAEPYTPTLEPTLSPFLPSIIDISTPSAVELIGEPVEVETITPPTVVDQILSPTVAPIAKPAKPGQGDIMNVLAALWFFS